MLPAPEVVQSLVGGLLDSGYQDATKSVLSAITRGLNSGTLNLRLQQFNEEADRLAAAGQKLTPENPVLSALLSEVTDTLKVNRALINGAAPGLRESAVDAGLQLTPQLSTGGANVQWNRPDPEAINRIVELVDSDAWAAELTDYTDGTLERMSDVIVRGVVSGQGPRATARQLALMIENLPRSTAETMMRSVQLNGYRAATTAMQVANADLIDYIVRIAVLDARCCLSCIALHGSRLKVGEEVKDHRNGRCTSVAVLKGAKGQSTQTYYVEGKPVTVTTGQDWLNAHSAAGQQGIMGSANYNAYSAGQVQLSDYVHSYDDALYGEVFTEASLKGILGEGAKAYYGR